MKDKTGISTQMRIENGFTLVEVLVAIVILVVGIVGIMGVFPTSYRTVSKAGRVSTVNHLAYQKMEQLKNLGFGNAALSGSSSGILHSDSGLQLFPGSTANYYYPIPDPGTSDPPINEYADYSLKWTVFSDTPVTGIKTVVIEVGYGPAYTSAGAVSSVQRMNSFLARFQFFVGSI